MLTAPTHLAASRWPEGLALWTDERAWTHAALEARIQDAARRLAALGVGPGRAVGLWGANGPDWVVALHAVTRLGAVAQLVSHRAADAEVHDLLVRGEAGWVLADAERLARARGFGLPAVALEALGDLPDGSNALPLGQPPERPFVRLATSGTSGRPKLVTLTWGQVLASGRAVSAVLGLGPADRWWCAMPTSHVGGLGILVRAPLAGAAVVLAARAGAEGFLAACERAGVTVASCVPTMLRDLADRCDATGWPGSLRALMLGGAPIPPDLVARCPLALATYGLSEACSTVTLVPPGADAATRATCGVPLPATRVRIVDEAGKGLAPEAIGRIQVAGPTVMAGYHGDAAVTARVLAEGWLDTGDFGALDAAGRLRVSARREDLIVSGGENVYPAEVEGVLVQHPAIADAAVTALSHPRWGQVPVAVVVWRGAPLAPEDLAPWLASRLARYKQPHAYLAVDALPLTGNGKPDRRALARLVGNERESGRRLLCPTTPPLSIP